MAGRKVITFVTGNINKVQEVKAILGADFAHEIKLEPLDIIEVQGDPEFVAKSKCQTAAKLISGPVMVEDTSLHLAALNGMPGPYIKYFEKALGLDQLHKLIDGWPNKAATAVCTMAYSEGADMDVRLFKGVLEGQLVARRGENGFGWDACFQPINSSETLAEMGAERKGQISHRRKAVLAFKQFWDGK